MQIKVQSEVEPLERVIVHRPGPEIVRMTQYELEPLLFDDILAADVAGEEHDLMRAILEAAGAEVLEITELLDSAVRRAPEDQLTDFVGRICDLAGHDHLAPILLQLDRGALARGLVQGLSWAELPEAPMTLARIRKQQLGERNMALSPLPNLMFTRDPCFALFDRIGVGRMATGARAREPLLVRFALMFAEARPAPFVFHEADWDRHPSFRSIEGGDVLVLSDRFLLIGCSERTTPQTIERVAEDHLFPTFPALERIHAVLMPPQRSVMHLDTVLTQIDRSMFLGHAPMVAQGEDTAVVTLQRGAPCRLLQGRSVLQVLDEELGGVTLVPCGGDDPLFQRREQWTDGANAVCLRPGHILLYSRNRRTTEALCRHHGFVERHLSLGRDDHAQILAEAQQHERVVYTFDGAELSRARGGARCMTMPLIRG